MRVLLDTNIYIYYYIPSNYVKKADEERWKQLRNKSRIVFESILAGKHKLIIPATILIEVAAKIFEFTGDEEKTGFIIGGLKDLVKNRIAEMAYLGELATDQSISSVYQSRLKAVDSTIMASCLVEQATVVTNDGELYLSLKSVPPDDDGRVIDAILLREASEQQLTDLFS